MRVTGERFKDDTSLAAATTIISYLYFPIDVYTLQRQSYLTFTFPYRYIQYNATSFHNDGIMYDYPHCVQKITHFTFLCIHTRKNNQFQRNVKWRRYANSTTLILSVELNHHRVYFRQLDP